jgi:eukaryotic-like serine/threonine-protein kinase
MTPSGPTITPADIAGLVKGAEVTGPMKTGGQKVVVPIRVDGKQLALKIFWLLPADNAPAPPTEDVTDRPEEEEAVARARREVGIISAADIPELVRLGPIPLSEGSIGDRQVIYYTEEWVEGRDLKTTLQQNGPLEPADVARLGIDMSRAIEWLWARSTIHRDIKPGNIMRRPNGGFVLLDMGMALDLGDVSLTAPGLAVGTLPYLSPEQLDTPKKRSMDFRSDMYSLGVTMYEVATGSHPYYRAGMSSTDTIVSIQSEKPKSPSQVRNGFPDDLSEIIMRLLAKQPHLRYRTCAKFLDELRPVAKSLGVDS